MADEFEEKLVRLGNAVRKRRQELGISQRELAAISKLHHNYISGIERGERNPTVITLWRLEEALKLHFIEINEV